ncbi:MULTISPECIES: YqjD family protein [unclassified Polaromonas]|uniref:DUF883 family protein n=1 Tax=unclassified Polaromonas TaxID=2638319 RepID=UPI0018CB547B|nr:MULTISPECIES: hypothetical protein [unclassified Polaromonas]MBG6071552.1 ElaB/YqjD/DUF883 family membrane-anchored ribosome-binding protein [Polaromonas sp. CG_9.7]MBG6113553.1 ElaB/YqjD/DUF883 family membrane-anchored ribosome-binding protein [Polaromonas sp. CG_9.2]
MENSTSHNGDHNPDTTASNALKRSVESAGSTLHDSIDKVVDPALDAVGHAGSAAHDAVNRLSSGATHVADRVSEQVSRVYEAPGYAVECSKSWIQDKPLEAVGLALALGFIIGRLTAH